MDEFIAAGLKRVGDPREVVSDEHATYFGAPRGEVLVGWPSFAAWSQGSISPTRMA